MRAFIEQMPNPSLSCELKFSVSLTGFSRYRNMASEFLSCARECGFYPNLGGTTDLLIVRPKLM